jgi:hypothetical protein
MKRHGTDMCTERTLRSKVILRGGARLSSTVALALALLALLPGSAVARIGGDHIFNAVLSLTGGIGTSSLDPVPDPGEAHPPKAFSQVCAVAVDSAGDTYVSDQAAGRIDIFGPEGLYLTQIEDEDRPCQLAVDAEGNLYVGQEGGSTSNAEQGVFRFSPSSYPVSPLTVYARSSQVAASRFSVAVDVDRSTGHVFLVDTVNGVVEELGSAAEGNPLLNADIGRGVLEHPEAIAADASTGRILVSSVCVGCPLIPDSQHPHVSLIYVLDKEGNVRARIDGSEMPSGGFQSGFGHIAPAVDEATGEVFVNDIFQGEKVYRFVPTSGGGYAYAPDPELESHGYKGEANSIAVANGGGLSTEHDVYVPAAGFSTGHLYAFTPERESGAPIETRANVPNVTQEEAGLSGEVNPNGFQSEYRFEYVSEATYLQDVEQLGPGHGFDHASVTSPGTLPAGHQLVGVFAGVEGLRPGASYRVRIVAANHCDTEEQAKVCESTGEETTFRTYPAGVVERNCPNEALRSGFSDVLPDCRAYELVSPPDTNGLTPSGTIISRELTEMPLVSPGGDSVSFVTYQGILPSLGGNGILSGYDARRNAAGWQTQSSGPSGAQMQAPRSGGASADHRYWLWAVVAPIDRGSLAIGGEEASYVRLPDGSFELLGQGPLGSDPGARADWMSADGSRLLFTSRKPLAEGASPEGVTTIYDRALGGETRVVSLKPDGAAPGAGAEVLYRGASADGSAVAFTVKEGGVTALYARLGGERTVRVAESAGGLTFAGLSADGSRLTYLSAGDAYSFDFASATSTPVGSGGKTTVVNVSADGSHVYFVSTKRLAPAATGAGAGLQNFYVWDAASQSVAFIAALDPLDLTGVSVESVGLGKWTTGLEQGTAIDPSRTTPDGQTIVFESRADLTGYDANGHREVYRYESGDPGGLSCLSCTPTLAAARSEAVLQAFAGVGHEPLHGTTDPTSPVANLSADGKRVFFQSGEALVPADDDGVQDVYEWEAEGVGGCTRAQGCLSLISSGRSGADNSLFAVTPSGSDVFFDTTDVLAGSDPSSMVSIYDARIHGGFPPAQGPAGECLGEACQSAAVAPVDATPTSFSFEGRGNAHPEAKKRHVKRLRAKCSRRRTSRHKRQACRRRRTNRKGRTKR